MCQAWMVLVLHPWPVISALLEQQLGQVLLLLQMLLQVLVLLAIFHHLMVLDLRCHLAVALLPQVHGCYCHSLVRW